MAASIKIEFDDGSKVMQRTLNVHDSATPAGYVNNIDIDILTDDDMKENASVKVFNWKSDTEFDFYYENEAVAKYIK